MQKVRVRENCPKIQLEWHNTCLSLLSMWGWKQQLHLFPLLVPRKPHPDLDHSIMLKSLSSFSDKSDSSKTVPFGVIHTYIAYWGEYLPCPQGNGRPNLRHSLRFWDNFLKRLLCFSLMTTSENHQTLNVMFLNAKG